MMIARQPEWHRTSRSGWLRAAVLGANDGIISTASLVLGVAAAHGSYASVMVAGTAGMVAGAMSMASGEYVSVRSQADIEQADLERERRELRDDRDGEHREPTTIYIGRELSDGSPRRWPINSWPMMQSGPMPRDELGISESLKARPVQAALTSATSFATGAVLPLIAGALAPERLTLLLVSGTRW